MKKLLLDKIYQNFLLKTPTKIDDIINESELNSTCINIILTELKDEGLITMDKLNVELTDKGLLSDKIWRK